MEEVANNIIRFPKDKIVDEAKAAISTDDIKLSMTLTHHAFIHEVVEDVLTNISAQLRGAGVPLGINISMNEGAFFVEALHALLCKEYGIDHPFHKLAEATFSMEADGNFRLNNNVHVIFYEESDES